MQIIVCIFWNGIKEYIAPKTITWQPKSVYNSLMIDPNFQSCLASEQKVTILCCCHTLYLSEMLHASSHFEPVLNQHHSSWLCEKCKYGPNTGLSLKMSSQRLLWSYATRWWHQEESHYNCMPATKLIIMVVYHIENTCLRAKIKPLNTRTVKFSYTCS